MNVTNTFFIITFISSTIFSDDVLNETVYWELTRVDAKIEEKKYEEDERWQRHGDRHARARGIILIVVAGRFQERKHPSPGPTS